MTYYEDRKVRDDKEMLVTLIEAIMQGYVVADENFRLPKSLDTLAKFNVKNFVHTLKLDEADWKPFRWKEYSPSRIEVLTKTTAEMLERMLEFASIVNKYRVGIGKSEVNFVALAAEINRRKEKNNANGSE